MKWLRKGPIFMRAMPYAVPQGLKPDDLAMLAGTDKSVPFQNSFRVEFFRSSLRVELFRSL
jgi:hypothetical protein